MVPACILLATPSMVAAANAAGLAVLTYGQENNQPAAVRLQVELGVKAVILGE